MLRLSSFLLLLALGHIAARPAGDSGAVEDTSSEGEEHVIHIPVRWDGPPQDPEEEKDVEERREDFPWTGESVSGQGERRTHPAGPQYDDQDEDAANSRYRRSASGRKYRKKGRRVPGRCIYLHFHPFFFYYTILHYPAIFDPHLACFFSGFMLRSTLIRER